MWKCGNDGPEIEPTDEMKSVLEQVKPQLEEKLGRSVTSLVIKKGRKEVISKKKIFVFFFVFREVVSWGPKKFREFSCTF